MRTDRELLELAARAAGYKVEKFDDDGGVWLNDSNPDYGYDWWNPLTDDGDSLRLAVKLEMDICTFADGAEILSKTVEPIIEDAYKNHGMDVYAATRRAIVRAAAAIGEQMK